MTEQPQESLVKENRDPLLSILNRIVIYSVKVLAVLMVLVIVWGLIATCAHLFQHMPNPFASNITIEEWLVTLSGFLAMLIAIEIFLNIVFYLKRDAINVPLVLATALTAVARKVILLDYAAGDPQYIFATAAVILAVGVTYWLVTKK